MVSKVQYAQSMKQILHVSLQSKLSVQILSLKLPAKHLGILHVWSIEILYIRKKKYVYIFTHTEIYIYIHQTSEKHIYG